jgi:hypothetical protein
MHALRRAIRMEYTSGQVLVSNTLEIRNKEIATGLIKRGIEDYDLIAEISTLSLRQVNDIKAKVDAEAESEVARQL